jgi:CheY-like chemotaxis protein
LDVPVTEATHLDVSPRKFLSLAVDNTHLKPLILVVEDNSVSQMLTEKIITSLGYRCAVADNGKHALEIVAARTPDLILMDLQMPTMDGLMCTQRLRQLTHMQKVPVVALTANPQEAIRSECMRAGMNAVLSKPVDVRKLTDVLSSLLSEQKQDPMGA